MSLGPYGLGGRFPPRTEPDSLSERIGFWFFVVTFTLGTPAFLLMAALSGHRH
jgi:hypothetical protein